MTNPDIIDQMHELNLEDRRISANAIDEQLGLSRDRVGSKIHEDLEKRKFYAYWVPKCLKVNGARRLSIIWKFFGYAQSE